MISVTFIPHGEDAQTVEAEEGSNLMQAAQDNLIDGILGECGGSCSCGTCHCYIDEAWLDKLPPASKFEQETLECALEIQKNSRLACQIKVSPELDGVVVRLPDSQL